MSAAGRAAAARLPSWPGWTGVTLVASSPEPKAVDTAAPIARALAVELQLEDGLREARRPGAVVGRAAYVRMASTYLLGHQVAAWEPADDVRRRVTDCVERLLAATNGDLAVVSHGLALSLFLGLAPEEWERIALPAVAVVEPTSWRVLEPWRTVA